MLCWEIKRVEWKLSGVGGSLGGALWAWVLQAAAQGPYYVGVGGGSPWVPHR